MTQRRGEIIGQVFFTRFPLNSPLLLSVSVTVSPPSDKDSPSFLVFSMLHPPLDLLIKGPKLVLREEKLFSRVLSSVRSFFACLDVCFSVTLSLNIGREK